MFICGEGRLVIDRVVCEACFGCGRYVTNRKLLKQRIGKVLRAHREKHGESVFQEVHRLGLDIVGPRIILSVEAGKLGAMCAYAPRFARRAALVAVRAVDAADPVAGESTS